MFKVCEIFRSIQGEGIDIGMPHIFIRFDGCNLKCTWCDSTYASRSNGEAKSMLVENIIEVIEGFAPTKGITLTGGEPFIQSPVEIDNLIYELKGRKFYINIETNGLFLPDLKNGNLVDRYSISPKMISSGNVLGVNTPTLKKYLKLYPDKIFLKFVIGDTEDFEQMIKILEELGDGLLKNNVPIVVQPDINFESANSIEVQKKKFMALLDLVLVGNYTNQVKTYGIRIIPQFHKYLWSNRRAV
jgi:7-carboxy-7-deazaguanine synthase